MSRWENLILKIALLTFVVNSLTAVAAGPHPRPIVIRRGTLFDSVNGVLLPDRTIVIVDGHIQAIGTPRQRARIPRGSRIIEARGKYVIPGLIDSHVHLAIGYDLGHVSGYNVLPLFLANGVTSVRDVGDDIMAEKFIADDASAHPELCPRVFLGSPLIDGNPPFHPQMGWSAVLTDPAKVPAFVDEMAAWGVITLKIYVGTGRAVGQKLIEEAHRHGMMVTGHLSNYTPLQAAEDGIDCIEHISAGSLYGYLSARTNPPGSEVDLNGPVARELIATLLAHNVMVDPTLVVFRNMLLLPDLPGIADSPENALVPEDLRKFWPTYAEQVKPDTLEQRKKEFRKYQDLTGLLFRAGIPLLAGTDEGMPYVVPGLSLQQELELLVQSGLPPAAALQAATINPARVLKQSNELGSLGEGKIADVVVLNANPLADIRNTRSIYKLVHQGVLCDSKALLTLVPATP